MDGGEEAGDEVLVQVLILAHLEDLLPLHVRHLLLQLLCRHLLPMPVMAAELRVVGNNKGCGIRVSRTAVLVEVTEQAKKARRYVRSLTPKALSPLWRCDREMCVMW